MVRWGDSLSITFRYSDEIRQGGQLSLLLYNVYTDDINHHLRDGVGGPTVLCRRCLGKFTELCG